MGEAGWRYVGEVGSRGGRRARGVRGVCVWGVGCVVSLGGVRGACVGRVCGAKIVCIARSTLLSGYLGKSRHLPKYRIVICIAYWISDTENHGLDIIQECNADQKLGRLTLFSLS